MTAYRETLELRRQRAEVVLNIIVANPGICMQDLATHKELKKIPSSLSATYQAIRGVVRQLKYQNLVDEDYKEVPGGNSPLVFNPSNMTAAFPYPIRLTDGWGIDPLRPEEIEEPDEPEEEEEPEFPPDPKGKKFAIDMSFGTWASGKIEEYQKLLYLDDEKILKLLVRHGLQRLEEVALNPDSFEVIDPF